MSTGITAMCGPPASHAAVIVAADDRLMTDNLMDPTHETHVHAGAIGQPELIDTSSPTPLRGGAE